MSPDRPRIHGPEDETPSRPSSTVSGLFYNQAVTPSEMRVRKRSSNRFNQSIGSTKVKYGTTMVGYLN